MVIVLLCNNNVDMGKMVDVELHYKHIRNDFMVESIDMGKVEVVLFENVLIDHILNVFIVIIKTV